MMAAALAAGGYDGFISGSPLTAGRADTTVPLQPDSRQGQQAASTLIHRRAYDVSGLEMVGNKSGPSNVIPMNPRVW